MDKLVAELPSLFKLYGSALAALVAVPWAWRALVKHEREQEADRYREEILQDVIKCMETMTVFWHEEMNDGDQLPYRLYMERVDGEIERLRCTRQISWSSTRLSNLIKDYEEVRRQIAEQDNDPDCSDWRINNPVLEAFETEWVVRIMGMVRWEHSMLTMLTESARDYVNHMTLKAEQQAREYWRQPEYGHNAVTQNSYAGSRASIQGVSQDQVESDMDNGMTESEW